MNCPFTKERLIERSLRIKGIELIRKHIPISYWNEIAEETVEEYNDWGSGQGFGSSDFTYTMKGFIDEMCNRIGGLETIFSPVLMVVKK